MTRYLAVGSITFLATLIIGGVVSESHALLAFAGGAVFGFTVLLIVGGIAAKLIGEAVE